MKTVICNKKTFKGFLPYLFVLKYSVGAFILFALAFILIILTDEIAVSVIEHKAEIIIKTNNTIIYTMR